MEAARRLVERILVLLGSREPFEEETEEYMTKSGHLWRIDSNGKWVKRWFELRTFE